MEWLRAHHLVVLAATFVACSGRRDLDAGSSKAASPRAVSSESTRLAKPSTPSEQYSAIDAGPATPDVVVAPRPPAQNPLVPKIEALATTIADDDTRRVEFARILDAEVPDIRAREAIFVELVERGVHDPIRWHSLTTSGGGHRVVFDVSSDALKIFGVRIPVTALGAQRIADYFESVLPTARLLQAIWNEAAIRAVPCTLPPDAKMATMGRVLEHTKCVDAHVAKQPGLVANVGKHWVLSNHLEGHPQLAANFGWFVAGHAPIQTLGTRHDVGHTDYSQIVRLVKRQVLLDEHREDIVAVGRSKSLAGLVSDEGPLRVWHLGANAEVRPTGGGDPAASVARAMALRSQVELLRTSFPVSVDRLPRATNEISRRGVYRQLASALRQPFDRLPNEALWSHGGALCGYRDPFFDLASGVPVTQREFVELATTTKDALACGKRVAAVLDGDAKFFAIDWIVGSREANVGIFRRGGGVLPEGVRFAPLRAGEGRAWCRDDVGPERDACTRGNVGRLLISVGGGVLGVRAQDAEPVLTALRAPHEIDATSRALMRALDELSDFEDAHVATAERCAYVLEHDASDSRKTFLADVQKHAVLCAVGERGAIGRVQSRVVFEAKSEASALALSTALDARLRSASSHVPTNAPPNDDEALYREFAAARRAGAFKRAKVSRTATRIVVELDESPEGDDHGEFERYSSVRAKRLEAVARCVRAFEAGGMPSDADLRAARSF